MRKILITLAFLVSLAPAVFAQVTAEIVLEQEHFLRSESLILRVRISNFSGQPVQFGGTPEWLTFTVQNRDGVALKPLSDVPSPKPFTVESSKTVSFRADLMPYFNLNEAGRYSVKVRVKVPQIEKEVTSEASDFDIVSGVKIWEQEVGLPGTKPPVLRKLALQQATFTKQARLYARVTDPTETEFVRVVPLGALVSFSKPEVLVDNSSQLHVLFQGGARTFHYSIVTPDGELIVRQTWDYGSIRPRLQSEDDGRVIVKGGARRILLSDLPPPRVADTNETTQSK